MIKSWKHKGLKQFYETGNTAGIQPKLAGIISLVLFQLANAVKPEDMNTPGNYFHKLKGELAGYYSVKINANWRIIFQFQGEDAVNVKLVDYH